MATKKRRIPVGKNIRIPEKYFDIIKKFVDSNNYKLGGFVAAAAMEKIDREKAK